LGLVVEKVVSTRAAITGSEAARSTWDAVVIGAGPAGSIAARQLALQSKSVLLVERQHWPRAKACGGCLNRRALAQLDALGLSSVVQAACGKPVQRLEIRNGRQRLEIPLPTGVAICRSQFDAELVQHAIEAGVTFLPRTTAHVAVERDSRAVRRVELRASGHSPWDVCAKIVIAADGLGHPSLGRLSEFRSVAQTEGKIGLAVELDLTPPWLSEGTIVMAIAPAGYVGVVATSDGRANVAAALRPGFVKSSGGAARLVDAILRDAHCSLPAISGMPCRGTPVLTRRSVRLIHERVFVLGDAAGYVEPFTGEGMAWAIESAVVATAWILHLMCEWDPTKAVRWDYALRQRTERNQSICRLASELLRRPGATGAALRVIRYFPGIVQPWVRRVHTSTRDSNALYESCD
jgi:flavin-dependent dehydrogenase